MPDPARRPRALSLRRAGALVLLAAAAAAGLVLLGEGGGLDLLREHRGALVALRDGHPLLARLGYMGVFAAVVALSVPGAFVLTLAGGFLFGFLPGTLLALVAGTAGATVVFLAARWGLGAALAARWRAHGGTFARVERGLKRNELSYLLLLRLVPAVPFPVANLAPAFFGVSAGRFAATTFVGIAPGTALTAWIGTGLGELLDRGEAPAALAEPRMAGLLIALALLAALPILLRRRGAHRL